MVAALTYVLFGIAIVIVFGCFYAGWVMVSDLAAGWSEARRCWRFPRQFSVGLLFAITVVAAVACFLLQGVRIEGPGQAIIMFALSLTCAAAIVYALHCMLSEYHRGVRWKGAAGRHAGPGEPSTPESGALASPPGDDGSGAEFEGWLSARVDCGSDVYDRARPTSTKAMRSHFRAQRSDSPKGVKFGRL